MKIGLPRVSWRDLHNWRRFSGGQQSKYPHVALEGPTQARKLESWEIGTGKVGPHVGIACLDVGAYSIRGAKAI